MKGRKIERAVRDADLVVRVRPLHQHGHLLVGLDERAQAEVLKLRVTATTR